MHKELASPMVGIRGARGAPPARNTAFTGKARSDTLSRVLRYQKHVLAKKWYLGQKERNLSQM